MNKIAIALVTVLAICSADDYPSMFGNMRTPCINKVMDQIGCEVRASLEYLKFGAHFSQDGVNRPGFSKFFFESASEEREHAIKLIEYLNMRGAHHPDVPNSKVDDLGEYKALLEHATKCNIFDQTFSDHNCNTVTSGVKGLTCALNMEIAVTTHINDLIRTCEKDKTEDVKACNAAQKNGRHVQCNDYHFVDYLTGEFLEEQYQGQRKLAGHLKTLDKMKDTHGNIGEFFFR